ncbi:MAG: hypothetical protein H7329_14780 [Opitutaceae bacterium]|nr:hypothetical protein [Cytophagales bacterium]
MKKILLILVVSLVRLDAIYGQDSLIFYKHIPASGLDKVSQDSYGNLYFSDLKGNINKYDSLGNYLINYSPQKLGTVSLLEAWNTIRIFVFYRDFQEYTILERFLGPMPGNPLNQEQIGFARQATLASDFNLWVIDETDFALKKYDRQFNKVVNKTSLDLLLDVREYDISFLREYQNNLYINDRNTGVLVFDAFGSYKKKIPFKGIDFFSFHENDLFYLQNDTVRFFDLYLFTENILTLPSGMKYKRVLIHDRKLYAIRPDGFDIYNIVGNPKRLR